ncbi:MAG: DUF86 domain-containing protein [Paludibacteraceae bacterium]|nr:DUF86 domain-containing protein [Paludibacteraceae bacterium]
MRESLRDKTRLEHILEAIERLEKYAGSLSREELEADVLRYYGIVKNIEIIGEAANMLTSLFKETHPEVEWRPISNMRNFLVHEYFQVDNDTVWAVIHGDIVELKKNILKYLAETDWEQWDKK